MKPEDIKKQPIKKELSEKEKFAEYRERKEAQKKERNKVTFGDKTQPYYRAFDNLDQLESISRSNPSLGLDEFVEKTNKKLLSAKTVKEIEEITEKVEKLRIEKGDIVYETKYKKFKDNYVKLFNKYKDKIESIRNELGELAKKKFDSTISMYKQQARLGEWDVTRRSVREGVVGHEKFFKGLEEQLKEEMEVIEESDGYATKNQFKKYSFHSDEAKILPKKEIKARIPLLKKWGKLIDKKIAELKEEREKLNENLEKEQIKDPFSKVMEELEISSLTRDMNSIEKEVTEQEDTEKLKNSYVFTMAKGSIKDMDNRINALRKENQRIEKNREKGIIGTWNRGKPKGMTENQKRNLARLKRIKKSYEEGRVYSIRDDTLESMSAESKEVKYDKKNRDYHRVRPYHLVSLLYDKETELLERYMKNIRHYFD